MGIGPILPPLLPPLRQRCSRAFRAVRHGPSGAKMPRSPRAHRPRAGRGAGVPNPRLRGGGLRLRAGGPPAAPDPDEALLPLPGGALHGDARRDRPPPHAADALGAGRVRRHRADGVQDEEEHRLPPQREERLHLRDGRHAAVPREPGGDRRRHRAVPHARLRHRRRGPHRAEAVPRRLDPDRLPADRRRRREREDPVPRPDPLRHAGDGGGGLLPRGARPRALHRLAGRPARDAAHRDRHGARPAGPPTRSRRRSSSSAASAARRGTSAPASAPRART